MITREEIIALREEADRFSTEKLSCEGEYHPDFHTVSDERFYAIAHEAGHASCEAEIAELKAELETERCLSFRNQVAELESERDQLREQVTLFRDALKYIDWCISNRPVISERIQAVLAATEPK